MERIWLKEYPEGVPEDIDPSQYASLKEILEESCAAFSDRPAYTNLGVEMTYGELDRLSLQVAAALQKTLGLKKGDRVALMMPNVLQYPVVLFGVLRAGLVAVNVNPLYTARELEHQMKDSGARAIFILDHFCHTLQKALAKAPVEHIFVTRLGDLLPPVKKTLVNFVVKYVKKLVPAWSIPEARTFLSLLEQGAGQTPDDVALTHDDIAFLQYTGGTTGTAKGAMLTHGNMVANVLQANAWLTPTIRKGEEIIITALPLYHIFALTANCLTYLRLGGKNVLITNARDYAGFVKELKKVPFTGITGVNTLYNALLNTPGFDEVDFSHLRVALGGGMAVQKAVAQRWKEVTNTPLIEAYGLTETSPAACINPMTNTEYNGSIGLPISSTWASIRNDAGEDLEIGEIGELCIKGPQVMPGYWERPKETAAVLSEDGWLRTGDIARMDEKGYLYIEDRKKDMILVSGFNVYPNEIESIVVEHPGVLEAAAIGVPHERTGEAVKLFVVRKDPALTADALQSFCRENMTAYKVPKFVEFRESLPKSNVGKILRRNLREETPSDPSA